MMRTIVCIGGGPSLKQEDVDYVRGRAEALVINDAYLITPFSRWMYACDYLWWKATRGDWGLPHHDLSRTMVPHALRFTRDPDAAREFGLRYIESRAGAGLCMLPGVINEGENGGFQAINLAYHLGALRIVLLGYDMQGTGHWHGGHPVNQGLCDGADFAHRQHHFDPLARDLARIGVDVINASRETGLTCFRRATIQEALA